jgi:xanthine dehydrogenase accessory factor
MDLFEEIVRMRRAGQRGALATIVHTNGSIPSYESSRMLVRDDGTIAGTVGGGCVEADVWAAAKDVIQKEQPRKMTFNLNHEAAYDAGLICGGTLGDFCRPILPQPMLYFSAAAVSPLARVANRRLRQVVDDRAGFANLDRPDGLRDLFTYEDARKFANPSYPDCRADTATTGASSFSRRPPARYIGMIGSKRKVISVYKALEKEGHDLEKFERVHAPVGLDIGALAPEEIAVSIAAELIAVRRNAPNLPHKAVRLSDVASLQHD